MSCVSFLSPQQRAALAASSADGAPLSSFASPPVTPGKLARIRALSSSDSARIRESAALSYHAPADVLTALATDPEPMVRRGVARNHATPPAVLAALARDADPTVRAWVAAHPAVPTTVMDSLTGDEDPMVSAVLAWSAGWT
ncbi:hypothetical protein [Nocardioides sp. AE5]|uniref:variant leucine-rich repeat-containing protein n=1 Tax=Nocardioides sp. AE5 TaxID=2962573 RepID=UPI00288290CB|nr:hypothetical protein [Nocardioides sp. AE5]MDT0203517.1 hypothetical protein [Nocardioides sp. AE5]